MLLYNGEIGEPCGTPTFVGTTCPLICTPTVSVCLISFSRLPSAIRFVISVISLPVRDTGEVRLEINLHDTPGTVVQVFPNRHGCLLGVPLRPVPVGAVVKIRLKDRLQDELHGRLHHTIFHRRNPEGSRAAFRLGNLDHPHGRELVALLAQRFVQFLIISSSYPVLIIISIAMPSTPGAPLFALTCRQASQRTSALQTLS